MLPVFVTGLYCGVGRLAAISFMRIQVLPVFVTGLYCGVDAAEAGATQAIEVLPVHPPYVTVSLVDY